MKRSILFFSLVIAVSPAFAQTNQSMKNAVLKSRQQKSSSSTNTKTNSSGLGKSSDQSRGTTGNTTAGNSNTSNLSNNQISAGLKEALKIGATNAAGKLSATDGYFKNSIVKILLPPEAQKVEQTLRSVGMGSVVDKAVLAMNRAAEDAAKTAAPIFIDAITSITLQDGLNILQGGNNAATNYLQGRTTAALTTAFEPIINKSLNKVGAPEIWKTVFNTYNSLPLMTNKVNPNLTGYVTEQALKGLFKTIGEEEAKIRTNPGAQVTNLLQQVFGGR